MINRVCYIIDAEIHFDFFIHFLKIVLLLWSCWISTSKTLIQEQQIQQR